MLHDQRRSDFASPYPRPLLTLSAVAAAMALLLTVIGLGIDSGASHGAQAPAKVAATGGEPGQRPPARILIWGIPKEVCVTYGGKYDDTSGLSEWVGQLALKEREVDRVSGILSLGDKELQFNSQSRKLDGAASAVQTFSLRSKDGRIFLNASRIDGERVEIKVGQSPREATYVYDPSTDKTGTPKLIKGEADTLERVFKEWDAFFLLPLLSYKLGVEAGLKGNLYPAALPVHRLALAAAKGRDIKLLTVSGNSLLGIGDWNPDADCTGRSPGNQECYGMCGPKCDSCWYWVCDDCCCHKGCRDHDHRCACGGPTACGVTAVAAPFDCSSCDKPTGLYSCPSSGGGSRCPSGQFFCTHAGGCLNNGAQCRPACGPAERYCERFGRCVSKTQCTNTTCAGRTCPRDQICIQGQCYNYEDVAGSPTKRLPTAALSAR